MNGTQGKGGLYLAIAASIVVVATLVGAIYVMGTPSEQRLARLDAGRVDDLIDLANAVRRRARTDGVMPATLQAAVAGSDASVNDRVTGAPYGYAVKSATAFQLCAVFDTATAQVRVADRYWHRAAQAEWNHPAGRHCFDLPLKESDAAVRIE